MKWVAHNLRFFLSPKLKYKRTGYVHKNGVKAVCSSFLSKKIEQMKMYLN